MEKVKVEKYFKRIGLEMPENIVPNAELLSKLHYAHCTHVPYENLDILRSVPLDLDYDSLFDKIVTRGRGGYCFELNGLLGWLLRELGISDPVLPFEEALYQAYETKRKEFQRSDLELD